MTGDALRAQACRKLANAHCWAAVIFAERAQRSLPGAERAEMCEVHAAAHRLSARDEYAAARRIEAGILDAAF